MQTPFPSAQERTLSAAAVPQTAVNLQVPLSSVSNSLFLSESRSASIFPHYIHSFIAAMYTSLYKRSNKKVDMFTLSELSGYPLLFCEKAVNYVTQGKRRNMTSDDFVKLFQTMYFDTLHNKTRFAAALFDFKQTDVVALNDVKVLLLHFHIRIFNDATEQQVVDIINNFYAGNANATQMTKKKFVKHSLSKNFDVVHLLFTYLEKYKPFDQEHLRHFQEMQVNMLSQSADNVRCCCCSNNGNSNNGNGNDNSVCIKSDDDFKSQTLIIHSIKGFAGDDNANQYSCFSNSIQPQQKLKLTAISKEVTPNTNNLFTNKEQFDMNTNAHGYYDGSEFISVEPFISTQASLYTQTVLAIPMCSNDLNDQEDNEMKTIMKVFDDNYKLATSTLKKVAPYNLHVISSSITNERRERVRSQTTVKDSAAVRNNGYGKAVYKFFRTKAKNSKEMRHKLHCSNNNPFAHSMNGSNCMSSAFSLNHYTKNESTNNADNILLPVSHSSGNCNPSLKKEIVVYKPNKQQTQFKPIKLVLISNMIFYYAQTAHSQYKFKKVIPITQLYPKLHSPCTSSLRSIPLPSKTYQLQLISSLHNFQVVYVLYFITRESFDAFINHLLLLQNIRSVEAMFTFGDKLGAGRFGKVLTGEHRLTKQRYAVKSVNKLEETQNEENYKCYMWEKDIFVFLKGVNDPHIEKCYDIYETPEHVYYVTELIRGGDLKSLINKHFFYDAHTRQHVLNDLTKQMLKGLQRLHHYGIIHRDIKHTNMLVNVVSESSVELKIIDFGLSKVMGYDDYAVEHYGSLSFKSPELVAGAKYSFNVDIWAMGITVYYCVYGTYPIKADTKQALKKLIMNFQLEQNAALLHKGSAKDYTNRVIAEALVRDPKKRASINQMVDIKELIEDEV